MTNIICPHCRKIQPVTFYEIQNTCFWCTEDLERTPIDVYVAGGKYPTEEGRKLFFMVTSGENELPYLTTNKERLHQLTFTHAHIYRVISENCLILDVQSEQAYAVEAPTNPTLPEAAVEWLREALEKGGYV